MDELRAVVLAAGKGTRLHSEREQLPKVMRLAGGRPLLAHVLDALPVRDPARVAIVVGYRKETVMAAFPAYRFAEQREQKGTGHAVMAAEAFIRAAAGPLLVASGDMPLVSRATYEALAAQHTAEGNDCTILVGSLPDGGAYGRILRDETGRFRCIREAKDCTDAERQVTEVNSGIYVFDPAKLLAALPQLTTRNAQGEYYLTDVPALLLESGGRVGLCVREMGKEINGVNTPEDLALVESLL